jgi:Trk-type K+ transport system membrane component
MEKKQRERGRLAPVLRAIVEIAFIVFLFYSNLLMGEFTRSNGGGKSLWFAMVDVMTGTNLTIALVSALIGYVGFEFLRKKL